MSEATWLSFVDDEESLNLLKNLVESSKLNVSFKHGGIVEAIAYLSHQVHTHLIVDLSDHANPLEAVNMLSEHCVEGTKLIIIGSQNNIEFYKKLKALGVTDYLLKPLKSDFVLECISNITSPRDEALHKNKMVAVTSSKGGLGASSFAINLSWLVSQNKKTCLMDFDIYNGISSLGLGVKGNEGLLQALRSPERIDDIFLKRLAVEVNDNLDLMTSELGLRNKFNLNEDAWHSLSHTVKQIYDASILDIPSGFSIKQSPLFSECEAVFILTDFSLVSIRNNNRFIDFFKSVNEEIELYFVGVRTTSAGFGEISKKQMEDSMQCKINYMLPFEPKLSLNALNLGEPITKTKNNHKIPQFFGKIIKQHFNKKIEEKHSWMNRWFKRG